METANITCAQTTCTLVISPYRATPDDYQAITLIYTAALIAGCFIWGGKQVYRLFTSRPEA